MIKLDADTDSIRQRYNRTAGFYAVNFWDYHSSSPSVEFMTGIPYVTDT